MKLLPAATRAGLRLIDHALDLHYKPVTFSDAPGCILQLARGHAAYDVQLRDGTAITAGMPIMVLHFWNERLAAWTDSDLTYGPMMVDGLRTSFRELAKFLAAHPEYDELPAAVGEIGLFPIDRIDQFRRFMNYLGVDVVELAHPGWHIFRRAFWDNAYSWGMMWTYNPTSLTNKRLKDIERCQCWISRDQLIKRYRKSQLSRGHRLPVSIVEPDLGPRE